MDKLRLKLIVIKILLVMQCTQLVIAMPHPKNMNFKCPETTSCICSYVIGYFDIECPPFEPAITVKIQPSQSIIIECASMDQNIYNLLPNMSIIEDIPIVNIRKCPLPGTNSLHTIFDRFGLKKVRTLMFYNQGSSLKRQHLSDFTNLERLQLSNNGLSELSEDLFMDVGNITWLNLRSNRLHISFNLFTPLRQLEYLELGHNKLHQLEPGVLRNQNKLKDLSLWGNSLQNLTKDAFQGVESIQDLDLSSNNIEYFNEDVFERLINLKMINLNTNHFQMLPSQLFANNKNLTIFKLMDNRVALTDLPDGLLANLTKLEIVLIRCDLVNLPYDLFMGSTNIVNLTLASNKIETLHGELFSDQIHLQDLDLSHNELTNLSDDLFFKTRSLVVLNLSHNKLNNISGVLFRHLTKLLHLSISHNNLLTIHRSAFSTTTQMQTLNLESNNLDFVEFDELSWNTQFVIERSSPFQSLVLLENLNLRNNSISSILLDWNIINTKLNVLDLSYNNITSIGYSNLQFISQNIIVHLTHNSIYNIDFRELEIISNAQDNDSSSSNNNNNNIRGDKSQIILVESNPINCDCLLLYFVHYLNGDLKLNSDKKFSVVPGHLQCDSPPKLQGVNVVALQPSDLLCPLDSPESNVTRLCPKLCECFVRLSDKTIIVDCSNRSLEQFTMPLPKVPELHFIELYLNNNNLYELPTIDNLSGYERVTKINANYNNISYIVPENIPKQLRALELTNNNLQSINSTIFERLNNSITFERISLGQNPWKCDCNLLDLLAYIHVDYRKINDLANIVCYKDENSLLMHQDDNNAIKVTTLTNSELCPEDQTAVISISVIAMIFCLFGILAAVYYKYQQEIKVWLFAHNLCLWFVTEYELDKDKKYDAFISYSHKDEDFVTEFLVPELENGLNPFKLCLHIRDWVVGEFIPNQIAQSVEDSRRTIVVLSPNFIESIWGRMEFRAAHTRALTEGRARVIVIIYGDIGNTEDLDPELKAYLNMNTYIKWGDPWFWNRLRYAMPHSSAGNRLKPTVHDLLKNPTMKSSVDDKLELIKPIPLTPPLTTPPAEQTIVNHYPSLNGVGNGVLGNGNTKLTINKDHTNNGNNNTNSINSNNKNGKLGAHNELNGHVNGAFIINTNAKQSDV